MYIERDKRKKLNKMKRHRLLEMMGEGEKKDKNKETIDMEVDNESGSSEEEGDD